MPRILTVLGVVCTASLVCEAAGAQALAGYESIVSDSRIRSGENHWRLVGGVELATKDTKIYADEAEVFLDEDRALATGNVVVTQGSNRVAADRADFNVKTRLGTFYHATGIANLQPPKPTSRPGVAAPPVSNQPTDVYFFGETVEKIGPKKYRITNGGFTTCVQPTPRWDLHADTVILNVDHYTVLRQAVLTVKGVPMLYVPLLIYPTKKEDRATGFLIPTYGSSTLRGQQIHNAFFWAIDRSQDATFMHEYYSKIGQGATGEYRYNFGAGSDGVFSAHLLDQHEATYDQPDGTVSAIPASRTYEIRGNANQPLPGGFRARANISYFSSITSMQTFNTNVYDATRNQRTYGANVVGTWGGYSLNGTYDRSEYFYDTTDSSLTGGAPRFSFTKSERQLFGTDLYYSVNGEYVYLLREDKTSTSFVSRNLNRLDFSPQIRFPFKKWQWFTVNSSVSWRDTFYTRSLDASKRDPATGVIPTDAFIDESLNRRYFTVGAQAVGPVFNRVWDTPDNGYAEKFKHSVEPYFNVQRTSSIDNADRIVQIEGADYIVGNTTQLGYGVRNRFYAKPRSKGGQPSIPRELFNVEISQTYYSNPTASQFDPRYSTSFTGVTTTPSNFSPIALSANATPSANLNTTFRAEFDARYRALRTVTLNSSYSWGGRLQESVGWSKRLAIPQLPGFSIPDHYLNSSTSVHTVDNRVGGIYSFNYDVLNSSMLQQRISGFYNAQCCGIAFEYQSYNFGGINPQLVPVAADHRFFLSFTLAGLGNFSPFNGALSGVPR
jgi:LPS-assembly protein